MKFCGDAGNAMQQQFTPIRRLSRNTSAVLFHDSPRQSWEVHAHVPHSNVKASADSTQGWHRNLLKRCGCYPLQFGRALRNEDSTSRHELMAVAFLEFLDGRFDVEAAPRTRSLSIQSDMLLATDSFLGSKSPSR